MDTVHTYDVIIIGAGAAGIGLATLFEKMGIHNYLVLEKDTVGSSFKQWSPYTHFISPSFTGNAFGAIDLNAVTPDTSPAHTLKTEHPSGPEYSKYLELIADHYKLKIAEGAEVSSITKDGDLFSISASDKTVTAKQLVWAGGEFQHPTVPNIPGAEHGVHSSLIKKPVGEELVIIGGYESGFDLAIAALKNGKRVTVIDAGTPWEETTSDSSVSISPYTKDRLRPFIGSDKLTILGNTKVTAIEKDAEGYLLKTTGQDIRSTERPVLAIGFENLPPVVSPLFADTGKGYVALTEDDESTITPGCFLAGPKVQHGDIIFCFIYKYRQRFPVVAETIAANLGLDLPLPDAYQQPGMYLANLAACGDECAC